MNDGTSCYTAHQLLIRTAVDNGVPVEMRDKNKPNDGWRDREESWPPPGPVAFTRHDYRLKDSDPKPAEYTPEQEHIVAAFQMGAVVEYWNDADHCWTRKSGSDFVFGKVEYRIAPLVDFSQPELIEYAAKMELPMELRVDGRDWHATIPASGIAYNKALSNEIRFRLANGLVPNSHKCLITSAVLRKLPVELKYGENHWVPRNIYEPVASLNFRGCEYRLRLPKTNLQARVPASVMKVETTFGTDPIKDMIASAALLGCQVEYAAEFLNNMTSGFLSDWTVVQEGHLFDTKEHAYRIVPKAKPSPSQPPELFVNCYKRKDNGEWGTLALPSKGAAEYAYNKANKNGWMKDYYSEIQIAVPYSPKKD